MLLYFKPYTLMSILVISFSFSLGCGPDAQKKPATDSNKKFQDQSELAKEENQSPMESDKKDEEVKSEEEKSSDKAQVAPTTAPAPAQTPEKAAEVAPAAPPKATPNNPPSNPEGESSEFVCTYNVDGVISKGNSKAECDKLKKKLGFDF